MGGAIAALWRAVADLTSLPSRVLVGLGVALLVAGGCLILLSHLDPASLGAGVQTITAICVVLGVAALVLAGFQAYAEAHTRTLEFVPIGPECWVGVAKQQNGLISTQIVCDLEVYNKTRVPRWLTDIKLARPRTHAKVLNHTIMGDEPIGPDGKSLARGHLIILADLSHRIDKWGIAVRIADQDKHWHTIKFPDARVQTRTLAPARSGCRPSAEERVT